jgi:hypothetical protein
MIPLERKANVIVMMVTCPLEDRCSFGGELMKPAELHANVMLVARNLLDGIMQQSRMISTRKSDATCPGDNKQSISFIF